MTMPAHMLTPFKQIPSIAIKSKILQNKKISPFIFQKVVILLPANNNITTLTVP